MLYFFLVDVMRIICLLSYCEASQATLKINGQGCYKQKKNESVVRFYKGFFQMCCTNDPKGYLYALWPSRYFFTSMMEAESGQRLCHISTFRIS